VPSVDGLLTAYCVFKDGTVGIWETDFSTFASGLPPPAAPAPASGKAGDPPPVKLQSIAFADKDTLWAVAQDNTSYQWQKPGPKAGSNDDTWNAGEWLHRPKLDGISMLTFQSALSQSPGSPVGLTAADGKIVKWDGQVTFDWLPPIEPQSDTKMSAVAWDRGKPPALWGIGADKLLYRWIDSDQQWEAFAPNKDTTLAMIAFDASNTMWAVHDPDGKLCRWDPGSSAPAAGAPAPAAGAAPATPRAPGWKQDDYFANLPAISWLAFKPAPAK
jgi:hypothetical protein